MPDRGTPPGRLCRTAGVAPLRGDAATRSGQATGEGFIQENTRPVPAGRKSAPSHPDAGRPGGRSAAGRCAAACRRRTCSWPMPPEQENKALTWPYWPYKLRTSSEPWYALGLKAVTTGKQHVLACTQSHHYMEGRHLVRFAFCKELSTIARASEQLRAWA